MLSIVLLSGLLVAWDQSSLLGRRTFLYWHSWMPCGSLFSPLFTF